MNIVLDLVFIIRFQMGAKGAAVATVIAQGTSGVLCLLYIIAKVPVLHIKRDDLQVGGTIYSNQLRIGIPMALQYSITAIGTMMVQSSLNILGSTLVAAYTAAGKIEQVVTQAYGAMGTTMATYGAQNMGAGSVKRIREGFKACTIVGVVYSIVAATFIMTVGKFIAQALNSISIDINHSKRNKKDPNTFQINIYRTHDHLHILRNKQIGHEFSDSHNKRCRVDRTWNSGCDCW